MAIGVQELLQAPDQVLIEAGGDAALVIANTRPERRHLGLEGADSRPVGRVAPRAARMAVVGP